LLLSPISSFMSIQSLSFYNYVIAQEIETNEMDNDIGNSANENNGDDGGGIEGIIQDCTNLDYAAANPNECVGPTLLDCTEQTHAAANSQCNNVLPTHKYTDTVSKNGTITIRKLAFTNKEPTLNRSHLITPNPYTAGGSYLVRDNDKNDFNIIEGEVTLKNIPFSPYNIQEVHKTYLPQNSILHDFNIFVNEDLPDPVINIVENHNLGEALPYEQIPFQYIIELKHNVIDDQNRRQTVPTGLERVNGFIEYENQSDDEPVGNRSSLPSIRTIDVDIAMV
jgi:hypothetical protein